MADATKPAGTTGAPDDKTKGAGAAGPVKDAGGTGTATPKDTGEKKKKTLGNRGLEALLELVEAFGIDEIMKRRNEFAQKAIDTAAELPSPYREAAEMALNNAPTIAKLIKMATPPHIPLVGTIDDLAIDISRVIAEKMKAAGGSLTAASSGPSSPSSAPTSKTTATPTGSTATAADQAARVVRLAATLPQPDVFTFWYAGLSDVQREKFHKLVGGGSDDQALAVMKKSPAQIEDDIALLDKIADAGKGKKELSLLDLQTEVRKDKGLQRKVTRLIARYSRLDEVKFWQGVRTCKEASVRTVDGFRRLMDLPDKLLFSHLSLDPDAIPLSERAKKLTPAAIGAKIDATSGAIDQATGVVDPSWKGPAWLAKIKGQVKGAYDKSEAEKQAKKGGRP